MSMIDRLGPLLEHRRVDDDVTSNAILDALIGGIADGLERVGLVAFGDVDVPAERVLRDPRYAPLWALAHAAMYTGAVLPGRLAGELEDAYLTRARDAVTSPLGIRRGTHEAIQRVAQPLLTGSKTVIIADDAGDYDVTVRTLSAETPDPDAVQAAIEGDFVSGGRRGALRAELRLTYIVSDAVTFGEATRAAGAVTGTATGANVTRGDVT